MSHIEITNNLKITKYFKVGKIENIFLKIIKDYRFPIMVIRESFERITREIISANDFDNSTESLELFSFPIVKGVKYWKVLVYKKQGIVDYEVMIVFPCIKENMEKYSIDIFHKGTMTKKGTEGDFAEKIQEIINKIENNILVEISGCDGSN